VHVRDEVRRLAARGGDLTEVRAGLDRVLRTSVGYGAGAISTVDPATKLWTSCYVSGAPADAGRDRERILFDIEFRVVTSTPTRRSPTPPSPSGACTPRPR
jgi:hypothetical protein